MAVVNLSNVSKKFKKNRSIISKITLPSLSGHKLEHDDKWALRNISLQIKKGEAVGILGLNSAGKTTLIRIIAGIIQPTEGTCKTQGKVVYFSVIANLYRHIPLKDNLYVYGAFMGYDRKRVNQVLRHPSFSCWIDPFLNLNMYQCSTGIFVRATFLMAVLSDADTLLIDEGPVFTDIEFQAMAFSLLRKVKENGTSIVMASHNLDFMGKVCNRVVLLDKGEIERTGDLRSVQAYYSHKYAANI